MMAEEKALYKNLALEKKFKLLAYEAVSEHHFLKNQIKKMLKKINSLRTLGEQDQIDLRVISKFYLNHLFFEEKDLLPEIQNEFEKSELMTWGERYFSLRKDEFSKMGPFPVLEEELISWKDSIQKLSSQLLLQMDQQVSQLKH
jgi:hemerythrin-like domain-containing protein